MDSNQRNRIEKSWTTSSGHNAVCFTKLGYRCGYVEIPRDELDKLDVNDPMDYDSYPINCHGGLTFCGTSYWDEENVNIWIGFDCMHMGDLMDPSLMKPLEYSLLNNIYNFGTIKDLTFVSNECEKIGTQLNELRKIKTDKTPQ